MPRLRHLVRHFYPRPPRGGRHGKHKVWVIKEVFLSTPSARRATRVQGVLSQAPGYFYPRPPRGGRLNDIILIGLGKRISIHALREEGDAGWKPGLSYADLFLSTPSARRATQRHHPHRPGKKNFYPRPPRGGRRRMEARTELCRFISIHALREEGDIASVLLDGLT